MPLLGYVPIWQRTQEQQDANDAAVATMPRMALTPIPMAKGDKVWLFNAWKAPEVIADVGFTFDRFHQLTGSCFLAGTRVLMKNGSTKYIEEIKAGEEVVTHNDRIRKVVAPTSRRYTGAIHRIVVKDSDGKIENASIVKCTADHKFLVKTDNGTDWEHAERLDGREVFYNKEVRKVAGYTTSNYVNNINVYCLKVEEDESFISNGYKVHNCVGAGGGNALATLIFTQRLLAENPTKAFIPWWPFNYGRSRLLAGMRGRGEGSMGATFFKSLVEDGVVSASEQGLPKFTDSDGLTLTSQLEMTWSDGASSVVSQYQGIAKSHPIGSSSQIRSVDQILASIQNGYPCTFACNNFVGNASIQGSGDEACVVGYWDHYGPHQQSIHGVWEHPNLGPLYYVQNNWPGSTYPRDPAGGPICGCWVKQSKVEAAMRLDSEVFALSHLNWFPAQPSVMEYWA